jgi:hypothetical protein
MGHQKQSTFHEDGLCTQNHLPNHLKHPQKILSVLEGHVIQQNFSLTKGDWKAKLERVIAFLFFKFLVVIPGGYLPGITRFF